jgi:hypothetical protein
MRAVFTLQLPGFEISSEKKNGDTESFPADQEVICLLDTFGWTLDLSVIEPKDIIAIIGERDLSTTESRGNSSAAGIVSRSEELADPRRHFVSITDPIFDEMPEVAAAEQGRAIYIGYISSEQTPFIVTRIVPGELTFRLLHKELERLQKATILLVRKLVGRPLRGRPLIIADPVVKIYERRNNHVIIEGRIVTRPLQEIMQDRLIDTIVFAFSLSLAIVSLPPLWRDFMNDNMVFGMLERFNTALITTALILAIQLFGAWVQVKRYRLIRWQ